MWYGVGVYRWETNLLELTKEFINTVIEYIPTSGKLVWKDGARKIMRNNRVRDGGEAFTSLDTHGYKRGKLLNKNIQAHRLIWFIVFGYWPKQVDHINGCRTDNRINNLRETDQQINRMNCAIQSNNTSGYKGVCWCKTNKKFVSRISVKGKRKLIGYFDSKEEAFNEYVKIARDNGYTERHIFGDHS